MSHTVGLPVALAARLLLRGELPLTGSAIPTHPSIVDPILRELGAAGLEFVERRSTRETQGA
jgi:saccharopine dehydrogenase (NADP+, L-glutamate forming)